MPKLVNPKKYGDVVPLEKPPGFKKKKGDRFIIRKIKPGNLKRQKKRQKV